MNERYLEDLRAGDRFGSPTHTVTEGAIRDFAREFDPQPFHLDPEAARGTLFNGLAASGWHTAAITMRLMVQGEMRIAGGLIGVGVEGLQWPRPVRPGDTLAVESEVVEVRPSTSRPDRGVVKVRNVTRNQHGEIVFSSVAVLLVPRRHPAGSPA